MLRMITVGALAASVVLAGCGPSAAPTPGAAGSNSPSAGPPVPARVSAGGLVMVIRHGEKPDDSHQGVDVDGNEDDSSLTEIGWDRARRLVDLFDPAQGSSRPGLDRPATIYAAGANDDGEGARTRETVMPLADELGIAVETRFGKGDEEELVEHVLTRPGPTLISWQHGGIPAIADAFPKLTPNPPSEWPDDRFDVVWTFTRTPAGWHFAQLPQLVLPQDRSDAIED